MGMPGVFTHGTFDTWTPGYLMFIAATHNGISRLYETFGNGGADTLERTLGPNDTARTWYKQNPPLPKAKWSQRNNNNYQQTGLLVSLNHFADNKNLFLKNFYLKSKRSILKPKTEGPAAYVFPGDDPRPGPQADLLRILQLQGCEISRATAPFTVTVPGRQRPARETTNDATATATATAASAGRAASRRTAPAPRRTSRRRRRSRTFPAGTYVLRMDQPYSRIADTLLDYQYRAPDDPQRNPYDDTGWTFGELFNVQVVRVTDVKVLDATMEPVKGDVTAPGGVDRHAARSSRSTTTPIRRWRRCATGSRTRSSTSPRSRSKSGGQKFNRGSFIIRGVDARRSRQGGDRARAEGRRRWRRRRSVKTHPARAARVALMHTWINTQDEGWWRLALDQIAVPFTYISTQDVAADRDLRSKYDVILFPPVGRGAGQQIITGLPMYGNPLPWKTTRADAEHRQDRFDRRHASGPRLGGHGQPAEVRARRRRARHGRRHGELRGSIRLHRRRVGDAGAAPQDHRRGAALEGGRRRAARSPTATTRTCRSTRRTARSSASAAWSAAAAAAAAAARAGGRPGAAPRTNRISRRDARRPSRCRRTRASSRGRRRRSARSSSATASASFPPAQRPRVVLALRRRPRPAGLGPARRRHRDRAAADGDRRAGRQGPRGDVLEQPDLARRNARQLLPRAQRHPESRQPGRGRELDRR